MWAGEMKFNAKGNFFAILSYYKIHRNIMTLIIMTDFFKIKLIHIKHFFFFFKPFFFLLILIYFGGTAQVEEGQIEGYRESEVGSVLTG